MSVNLDQVKKYFPKGSVSTEGDKVKVHVAELKTEDIANLYKLSEPNHFDGTFGQEVSLKRSGTGITAIFE